MATVLGVAFPVAAQQPSPSGDAPEVTVPQGQEEPVGQPPPPQRDAPPPAIQQRPGRGQLSPGELAPSFMTLDRMDAATRVGVQVGFSKLDDVAVDDAFFMRFDLYGQYVIPDHNLGVYGQLPISRGFLSDTLGGSTTAVGNIDGGVYFMPQGGNELIVRGGIMLPTASDGLNDAVVNSVTAYGRVTDLPLAVPNTTMLRLSVSTVQQREMFFFRGDLGLDLIVDQDVDSERDIYGRLNVAGGVRLPSVDLSAELATYGVLDGPEMPSVSDRFVHTAAFALRSRGENQVHAGFVLPLDEQLRGDLWIVSVGYQRAM